MKKTLYVKPVIEFFDADLEEGLLVTSYGTPGSAGPDLTDDPDDVYNL